MQEVKNYNNINISIPIKGVFCFKTGVLSE